MSSVSRGLVVAVLAALAASPSAAVAAEPASVDQVQPASDWAPPIPDDGAVPDVPATDEEMDLFAEEGSEVDGTDEAEEGVIFLLQEETAELFLRASSATAAKFFLLGPTDKSKNTEVEKFTGLRLAMARNAAQSFVIGYGLANGKKASRFDAGKAWKRRVWHAGFVYGGLESCGWIQTDRLADANYADAQQVPRRCEDPRVRERAPLAFAALINCDACNGPQYLDRPSGSPKTAAEAYRNVKPWQKATEPSQPFKQPWDMVKAGKKDPMWRYISRDWRYVAVVKPHMRRGFNTVFVPIGQVFDLPADWGSRNAAQRRRFVCALTPGRRPKDPIQKRHLASWPQVCDISTPPAGVSEARCNRLVSFRWENGSCEFQDPRQNVELPRLTGAPPSIVGCGRTSPGLCTTFPGEWGNYTEIKYIKAFCEPGQLEGECGYEWDDPTPHAYFGNYGESCTTRWHEITVVVRNAAGSVRYPLRTIGEDLGCIH